MLWRFRDVKNLLFRKFEAVELLIELVPDSEPSSQMSQKTP